MVAVNPAFDALTGYDAAESVGRNCRFLQGPDTDPDAAPASAPASTPGRAASSGSSTTAATARRSGTCCSSLPVHDAGGALRYFFGNQLDITLGFPDWLVDVSFGRAHVVPALETEFHALLREVGVAEQAQALDRIVAAAHRLAEITVQLAPGTLDGPAGRFGALER